MCSNASDKNLDREYIYVRRLISVLTNDDSDKLIVEKLKGKNLSSLLYNAKIIDNSKNMTANKKILACVIRAIEREKQMCRERELERSWGRKFLQTFNCLYPGLKENEDYGEKSALSRGCLRDRNVTQKTHTLSRHTRTSTRTSKTACMNGFKNSCKPSAACAKTVSEVEKHHQIRDKPNSYMESFRNKTYSCIDSIMTDRPEDNDDDLLSKCHKPFHLAPIKCLLKHQKVVYETIRPPLLRQRKLKCVMVYPGRPIPTIRRVENPEKKSSSTQTPDSSYKADPLLAKLPDLKLQDLLEAASSLINTEAQREYVRSFLKNYEPPFDLSAGFPPYLKLPMEESYVAGEESVYGTNSELSVRAGGLSPARQPLTSNEIIRQKEENVRNYVRDIVMNDSWQDAAESVVSGVINETLPHNKADYSKLGACILKHLGAYPESRSYKETRSPKQNFNIPEIILQCTEFFESDGGCSETKLLPEPNKLNTGLEKVEDPKTDEFPSIAEHNFMEERGAARPQEVQEVQNYCFLDNNNQNLDLLNLSERSLVGTGTSKEDNKKVCNKELAAQGDGSWDRKNLTLRQPLKITPSGLENSGKKANNASIFGRRSENKGKPKTSEPKRVPAVANITLEQSVLSKEIPNKERPSRQKDYALPSDKNQEPLVKVEGTKEESGVIEIIPTLRADVLQPETDPSGKGNDNHANEHADAQIYQGASPTEIIETETPPPELVQPCWEPAEAEFETFEGMGEDQGHLTGSSMSKSDKKQLLTKNRSFQEKVRGKKKCKVTSRKKAHSGKNDEDLSRNCRVM